VFWRFVIACLVPGVRWLAGQGHPARRDEAFEILRQRYAGRDDIDKREFETRQHDLSPSKHGSEQPLDHTRNAASARIWRSVGLSSCWLDTGVSSLRGNGG
jgi:hypothetical protein